MGYKPITYCPTCGESNDVYMLPENRFCSEECETAMTAMKDVARCELCGEPMPEGETMFKYHGYSGPCPKPLLPKSTVEVVVARTAWIPVHPERGPDWGYLLWQEDRPTAELALHYRWRRCVLKIDNED